MGNMTSGPLKFDRVDAVICDFDNTLVDSERMNTELFVRFFRDLAGVESTAEDRRFIDGAAFGDVIRRYAGFYTERLYGFGADDLKIRFLNYKKSAVSSFSIRIADGVDELIAANLPLAIVSGSYRTEIEAVATAAGLPLGVFDPVLGSDMYFPWKPEPTGLLHAAKKMGVPPERVVVLEDSRSGLLAARRAEMHPVHIDQFATLAAKEALEITPHTYPTIATFVAALQQLDNT